VTDAPGAAGCTARPTASGEQRVEVTVTEDTRTIMGIEARVVHDVVTEDGALVEDTYDWYAQDAAGNIWYLGEDTKEYENGEVKTTAGSWEAGVGGAQPGVVAGRPQPASPTGRSTRRRGEDAAGAQPDEGHRPVRLLEGVP
jgi:hypothetical protein